jgi:hypothetical protein
MIAKQLSMNGKKTLSSILKLIKEMMKMEKSISQLILILKED